MSISRRDFLGAGATTVAGLALTSAVDATPLVPYAVNKCGDYAGGAAYEGPGGGVQYAVADAKGARLEKCVYLFKEAERPKDKPPSGTMILPG